MVNRYSRHCSAGITAAIILALAGCNGQPPGRSNGASAAQAAMLSPPARAFLSGLDASQRATASFRFDDPERINWAYVPQRRAGLPLKDMNDTQRAAGFALLGTGLSARGTSLARGIIDLERTLGELEGFSLPPGRDPGRYFVSLFAAPGDTLPWGWRFEGHHLSVNVTELGPHGQVVAPLFMGANPARVPTGPQQGQRLLAQEEDLGFALLRLFDPQQRARAIIAAGTFGDIVTGSDPAVRSMPLAGLPAAAMTVDQQRQLRQLLALYAGRMADTSASRQLRRIEEAGFERLHFAWAGASAPGAPHYYRIHGPTVLVEYDNSQNNANHIHTVWRDLENDFGVDLLRKHYARQPHGR
ncbi:MAG TPA: DUF3500 domain-containing protein [Gemmatimonas sp.]|nr:DUF3500 domain-containing protein [Gemmatimonas sp.]